MFSRHAETRLQTRLTPKGLQQCLLELYLDARTLEEEQGVNILYLIGASTRELVLGVVDGLVRFERLSE